MGLLLKGPGWYPGTPRLGDPADIPEVGVVRDRMGVVIQKSMCMCPNCFECHIHIQSFSGHSSNIDTCFCPGLYKTTPAIMGTQSCN